MTEIAADEVGVEMWLWLSLFSSLRSVIADTAMDVKGLSSLSID